MDAWTVTIAAVGVLCVEALAVADAIGGQETSAPFEVDLMGRTINTGKGVVAAEVTSGAFKWHEDGVLRTIDRNTYAVFRQLPEGSSFQIGTCRPSER